MVPFLISAHIIICPGFGKVFLGFQYMLKGLNLPAGRVSHVPVIKMQICYTAMCILTIVSLLHWFLFTSSLSVQRSIIPLCPAVNINRKSMFPYCTCQVYTCVHVHEIKQLIDEIKNVTTHCSCSL